MAEVSEKDLFQRVDLSHTADREKIASPSLNFLQDSWRRLTKNKGAVFSLVKCAICEFTCSYSWTL